MFKKLLLASMLVALTTTASAFEIKGITLGQPLPEDHKMTCEKKDYGSRCAFKTSFADIKNVDISATVNKSGLVASIFVLSTDKKFREILPLLIKKYGVPTTDESNATFNHMIWENKNNDNLGFVAVKPAYSSRLEPSYILATTEVQRQEVEKANEAKEQEKLNNM